MKQQDIIWVRLPFTNLEESKIRPAVIVSNGDYNKIYGDVIVCAVTSKLEETPYSILIDQKDISAGKLPIKSRIRADKIMQIEKSLIIKPFAKLNDKTFDTLVEMITHIIKRS